MAAMQQILAKLIRITQWIGIPENKQLNITYYTFTTQTFLVTTVKQARAECPPQAPGLYLPPPLSPQFK